MCTLGVLPEQIADARVDMRPYEPGAVGLIVRLGCLLFQQKKGLHSPVPRRMDLGRAWKELERHRVLQFKGFDGGTWSRVWLHVKAERRTLTSSAQSCSATKPEPNLAAAALSPPHQASSSAQAPLEAPRPFRG